MQMYCVLISALICYNVSSMSNEISTTIHYLVIKKVIWYYYVILKNIFCFAENTYKKGIEKGNENHKNKMKIIKRIKTTKFEF